MGHEADEVLLHSLDLARARHVPEHDDAPLYILAGAADRRRGKADGDFSSVLPPDAELPLYHVPDPPYRLDDWTVAGVQGLAGAAPHGEGLIPGAAQTVFQAGAGRHLHRGIQ